MSRVKHKRGGPEYALSVQLHRFGLLEQTIAILERHGVNLEEVEGDSRSAHIVEARHEAIAFVREQRDAFGRHRFSLPVIGQMFQRDHTSIMAALAKWEHRRSLFCAVVPRWAAPMAERAPDILSVPWVMG